MKVIFALQILRLEFTFLGCQLLLANDVLLMHHDSFSTLNFRFTYIEAKVTGKLLPNMEPMIIIMSFEMLSDKLSNDFLILGQTIVFPG